MTAIKSPKVRVDPVAVARLLDAAANAAWKCRRRDMAISVARNLLGDAPRPSARMALAMWSRTAGYDGPMEGLTSHLSAKYRDAGDIALSLMRAALMVEQERAQGGAS